jgi:hypothetical protein
MFSPGSAVPQASTSEAPHVCDGNRGSRGQEKERPQLGHDQNTERAPCQRSLARTGKHLLNTLL